MKKWMWVLLLLAAACRREMPVQKQSVMAPPPPKPRPPAVSYYEGTHAAEAIQQIRAKVGEPFRVLNIRIDSDSLSLQAQDPKKKENVDEYSWSRGELGDPVRSASSARRIRRPSRRTSSILPPSI